MAAPTQLAFPQLGAGKSSQSEVMLGEDGVTRSRREGSPQLGALRPRQRGGTVSSSSHHQVGPQEGTVRQQADPTKSILLTRLASHGILMHVPHIRSRTSQNGQYRQVVCLPQNRNRRTTCQLSCRGNVSRRKSYRFWQQ